MTDFQLTLASLGGKPANEIEAFKPRPIQTLSLTSIGVKEEKPTNPVQTGFPPEYKMYSSLPTTGKPPGRHPPSGQLLNKYCVGTAMYGEFADGYGGDYTKVIELDCLECNGTGPVTTPFALNLIGSREPIVDQLRPADQISPLTVAPIEYLDVAFSIGQTTIITNGGTVKWVENARQGRGKPADEEQAPLVQAIIQFAKANNLYSDPPSVLADFINFHKAKGL